MGLYAQRTRFAGEASGVMLYVYGFGYRLIEFRQAGGIDE